MEKANKFIENMKGYYGMTSAQVLYAIQTDSQHEFIMDNQNVGVKEATEIIKVAEEFLEMN